MTKQRIWPNNQRHYRDRAAEEAASAQRKAKMLLERVKTGQFTRHGLEVDLLTIRAHLLESLRHLEKAGAKTEPE